MPLSVTDKRSILDLYPQVQAVFTRTEHGQETIVVITKDDFRGPQQAVPGTLYALPVSVKPQPRIRDLRFWLADYPAPRPDPFGPDHQNCHNEPVPGGVQLQPRGAGWLGTLGCACSFVAPAGHRRWGILSNWHVMVTGSSPGAHPQHQPTDQYPAIAHLTDFEEVSAGKTNYIDAAVADADIDGLHSVGPQLLGAGKMATEPTDALQDIAVAKSGRTTGYQLGLCVGTGAVVSIGYGNFTATFHDQDVFEGSTGDFSGPGDSGSLIFTAADRSPVALLFAGGGGTTIGCPIRHVIDRFKIHFRFP